jgi:hypothetical protein
MRIEMPDERDRIKELEREKRALESALAKAHMKILFLESTVEALEEESGQRAKKSPTCHPPEGPKQRTPCELHLPDAPDESPGDVPVSRT